MKWVSTRTAVVTPMIAEEENLLSFSAARLRGGASRIRKINNSWRFFCAI